MPFEGYGNQNLVILVPIGSAYMVPGLLGGRRVLESRLVSASGCSLNVQGSLNMHLEGSPSIPKKQIPPLGVLRLTKVVLNDSPCRDHCPSGGHIRHEPAASDPGLEPCDETSPL